MSNTDSLTESLRVRITRDGHCERVGTNQCTHVNSMASDSMANRPANSILFVMADLMADDD